MRKSILKGVGDIIDGALDLKRIDRKSIGKAPHYRHLKSCLTLRERVHDFDAKALINKIYEKLKSNLIAERMPSKKNWCLRKNLAKTDESKAKNRERKIEVKLERLIIKTSADWFNQIPTASGLMDEHSDKRGSIDLVYRCGGGLYEFIELKVTSNNPLYAAMEILQYGALYILARMDRQVMNAGKEKELLKAKAIRLKVLAPTNYYERFKLDWLENEINSGLEGFLQDRHLPFKMKFKFEAFPPYFNLSSFPKDEAIKEALENRRPVYP